MATKTVMPLAEYLQSSFENPQPDYVEGELLERSMPNSFHSSTQMNLLEGFRAWQLRRELFRYPEIRIRTASGKFRVADVAIFTSVQATPIPEDAPFAVIEIVSPDDRHEDLLNKLADYEEAGIEYIFVADPPLKKLSRYRQGDLLKVAAIELTEFAVSIPLDAIFA